jgi:mono/diheme cytochrome c family protein
MPIARNINITVALGGLFLVLSQAQHKVDFQADIQPIFEKSCGSCHSAKAQMGKLRLDSAAAASRVLVPGHARDSILYQRVAGLGDQARMPMGGKLSADQIENIRAWIDQGAEWPAAVAAPKKHWAFVAPVRPATPKVKQAKWGSNAIDAFILERLETEKLAPAPEADRTTLLRRLSLDLIGLPPTPEEIDAFINDHGPKAYEKQVDRLLASPHYGERWARVWLDAARYADSDGFEKDKARQVWFYRDWVINAMNRDLPYDQFVIRQIAGDLLPNATQDDRVATGFLRNSMLNEEGGIDPEQFRLESLFDRMEAIGKGVLGVTIQCAQCHTHKFDPIAHEDYYRMLAFLNDSDEGNAAVYTPKDQMKVAEIFRRTAELEGGLRHRNADWEAQMAAWEKAQTGTQPRWITLSFPDEELSSGGQKLIRMDDGSFLAQGDPGINNDQKFTAKTKLEKITAIQLEMLTDANLPRGGPGRGINGMFALTEFGVDVKPLNADGAVKPVKVKIASATADVNPREAPLAAPLQSKGKTVKVTGPIEFAIDGKNTTAWGVDVGPGLRNQARKAVFRFAEPIAIPGGATLIVNLNQSHGGGDFYNNNLGRFRLSVTDALDAVADPLPKAVRDVLAIPRDHRTPAQIETVFRYWRTTVPAWRDTNEEIAVLWRDYPEGNSQLLVQLRDTPRQTHILTRGDHTKPAAEVQPGVPAFLNPLPRGAPVNRLAFAKWMVSRESPTTARSYVNRVWQNLFGTGIVSTSEDLGTQSETPSHPELLDWLAVEFMDSGWSMKKLDRTIVLSSTYRQSSHITPELYSRDPYNRLLARGPRFRVDAEVVRDIALAASGLLNPAVGGPSVYPPAPDFLFHRPVSYSNKDWFTSEGPDRYRRALYTFRYRSVPYPMLQTFDAPSGESSCVRRARSNTPLQALTMLNEPLFLEAARELAARTLRDGGADDTQRIRYAFRRCLGRVPDGAETDELLALLKKEERRFTEFGRDAAQFSGTADAGKAAWTAVSRVLLNLDETITKE